MDRRQKLVEIKKRLENKTNVLCISTQLIEAGVDISFASVIRFLAGLDSIVQASGRCNRNRELIDANGLRCMGKVKVIDIDPVKERLGNLTDIKIGKEKTKRIIREYGRENLLRSDVLTQYFKYFFFERASEMTYPLDSDSEETLFNLLGLNSMNPGKKNDCLNPDRQLTLLKQSFMAANKEFEVIDAPNRSVVVEHGEGVELVQKLRKSNTEINSSVYSTLLSDAQKFSINLYTNEFQEFVDRDVVRPAREEIYYLPSRYYSEEFGFSGELDSQ